MYQRLRNSSQKSDRIFFPFNNPGSLLKAPFDVVIPARYESSRLPGKLLLDICGRSMIHRVVDGAFRSSAERVIVAVDDERIGREVAAHTDAMVCSTSVHHPSGTDRVAETVTLLNLPQDRIVVNLQGDEPLIRGELIDQVAMKLYQSEYAQVATAASPLRSNEDLTDRNTVKCVIDELDNALYFSRSPIPYVTSGKLRPSLHLQHIGIYAYRAAYLQLHAKREVCALEAAESLEQLRVLYHGDRIVVHMEDTYESIGVDTEKDLERVRELIQQQDNN